jgi:hypothetical protein
MKPEARGYTYFVEKDQIERYKAMPAELKLRWIFLGNKLRMNLPSETIAIQEAFRKGER